MTFWSGPSMSFSDTSRSTWSCSHPDRCGASADKGPENARPVGCGEAGYDKDHLAGQPVLDTLQRGIGALRRILILRIVRASGRPVKGRSVARVPSGFTLDGASLRLQSHKISGGTGSMGDHNARR